MSVQSDNSSLSSFLPNLRINFIVTCISSLQLWRSARIICCKLVARIYIWLFISDVFSLCGGLVNWRNSNLKTCRSAWPRVCLPQTSGRTLVGGRSCGSVFVVGSGSSSRSPSITLKSARTSGGCVCSTLLTYLSFPRPSGNFTSFKKCPQIN